MYHFTGNFAQDVVASFAMVADPLSSAVGAQLKAARLDKKLSLVQLAALSGVSKNHLAAIERGANVSVAKLARIAPHIGIRALDLFGVSLTIDPPVAAEVRRHTIAAVRELLAVAELTRIEAPEQNGTIFDRAKQDVLALFDRLQFEEPHAREAKLDAAMVALSHLISSGADPLPVTFAQSLGARPSQTDASMPRSLAIHPDDVPLREESKRSRAQSKAGERRRK